MIDKGLPLTFWTRNNMLCEPYMRKCFPKVFRISRGMFPGVFQDVSQWNYRVISDIPKHELLKVSFINVLRKNRLYLSNFDYILYLHPLFPFSVPKYQKPLGIILDAIYQILWLIVIVPIMVLLFLFLILLLITYLRNRYLLSPKVTELLIVLAISAILASIVFIILTNAGLLPYTDDITCTEQAIGRTITAS